jgi:hypothetical protein
MMDENSNKLEMFAEKHALKLEKRGEVGFGRPCVGFIAGNGYVDYNAFKYPDFTPAFPQDNQYYPPDSVKDAYHKHDCLCVLVINDDYDEALRQLEIWVEDIESRGGKIYKFRTGATGIQAMVSGRIGWALRVRGEGGQ